MKPHAQQRHTVGVPLELALLVSGNEVHLSERHLGHCIYLSGIPNSFDQTVYWSSHKKYVVWPTLGVRLVASTVGDADQAAGHQ